MKKSKRVFTLPLKSKQNKQWRIRGRDAKDAPSGVQILSISCSFWENLANRMLAPPPRGNPRSATDKKTVCHQIENNLLTWNWKHLTYLAESAERRRSTRRTGAPQKCADTWRTSTGRSGTLIKDSSTDLPLAAVVITKTGLGCDCPDISNVRFVKSDNRYGT